MTNQPQPASTQPNANPAKPTKPWFKRWWVWALIVVLVFAGAQAIGEDSDEPQATQTSASASGSDESGEASPTETAAADQSDATQEAEESKADLTLDDGWEMDDSDGFAVYVRGYVSNNTDEAVTDYVQITFDALDKDGANLGTCIDNTNTIDANGKWKFEAICLEDDIAKVRFKEISGF